MNALSFEEIVELHDESIRIHGGSSGVLNEVAVRSAVEMPFSGFGDYEAYPSLPEKAAVLVFHLFRGTASETGTNE